MTGTAPHSREEAICANIGLVHTCAKRFAGRGQEYDDLFQAGCVGLIKAVDGFDRERGLCFSTYAVPVILGEMKRLFREGGSLKVSRALKELSLKATREREHFMIEQGREPTVAELAVRLGVEPAQAAQAVEAGLPTVSLSVGAGGDTPDSEIDIPVDSPEERITDRLALEQLLSRLERRDRQLMQLRYRRRLTQQQTADILAMTQVQVSRRERTLLLLLREELTKGSL